MFNNAKAKEAGIAAFQGRASIESVKQPRKNKEMYQMIPAKRFPDKYWANPDIRKDNNIPTHFGYGFE